ncbi:MULTISPECIES: hypothetical protein [Pseudomonas]|uniref:Uncharacterized protein n=1 Tax=Pseudomonas gingeri TaxID=117681 RepID=A0A7Y7WT39_9PSED|nr:MULTISPECIES: hypothetical protein [Pseudomonas]MPQ70521.1 hypothetical protein [Pseudomonas sp. MWU12-2323]NWB87215.1 hypothetical protein [Pseudomonas gingeri]
MSTKKKSQPSTQSLAPAEKARLEARLAVLDSPKADPIAPVMNALNPLLGDEPDDDPNQLHSRYRGQLLKVDINSIEPIDDDGINGFVQLYWNGQSILGSRYNFTSPVTTIPFPITLDLPGNYTLSPGTYPLTYRLHWGPNGVGSVPLMVNIDTLPPNGGSSGPEVILPPQVESEGITKEYLDAHPEGVLVTIPSTYGDAKLGDQIEVHYGTSIPDSIVVGIFTRTDMADPIEVFLTRALIGTAEGPHYIFYYLSDRKGNKGPESDFKRVGVTLTTRPTNLKVTVVPEAADGLIDYEDAISSGGVLVRLDAYDSPQFGQDKFVVSWDNITQPEVDIVGFPTFATVPFVDVKNGNDGPDTVDVDYVIRRGGNTYSNPPVTLIEVDKDLRKPGPPNPEDPPGEQNPALAQVVVQGRATTVPDKLTAADVGPDPAYDFVDAEVAIYPERKAGDHFQLYWRDVAVPPPGGVYDLLGTEDPLTFKVPFEVPRAIVLAGLNDSKFPVNYSISHPSVNGNVDYAVPKEVDVLVVPITVPDPAFQNLYEFDPSDRDTWIVACCSRRNDTILGEVIEVLVPGEPTASLADKTLDFTFQGWSDAAGSLPITGTRYTNTFTPTTEQATNGFIFKVPYEPYLRLIADKYCSIKYETVINGHPAPSNEDFKEVFMIINGTETCRTFDGVPCIS